MKKSVIVASTGTNLASGNATVAVPNSAIIYPFLNFLYSAYGADAADATIQLQGSVNGNYWKDVSTAVTLATSTTANSLFFTATAVIAAGDLTGYLRDNPVYYIDAATTVGNRGRKTATTYMLEGYLTHGAPTSGIFVVGETITGGTSGATAVVRATRTGELTYDTLAVSTFAALETITGGTSGATGTVIADATATRILGTFTAENGAGKTWIGQEYSSIISGESFPYAYLRLKITVNSVTKGFVDLSGLGKTYYK